MSQDNSSSCQNLIQESSCCFLLFNWKAICAVSLKIRSRRQRQGLAKVLTNGLNPRWVYTALCSDKWLLCFPGTSGLPKHSHWPLFSFALFLPPQRAESGRLQSLHCQLQSSPAFYQAVSLPTQGGNCCAMTLGAGSHSEKSVGLRFSRHDRPLWGRACRPALGAEGFSGLQNQGTVPVACSPGSGLFVVTP